MADGEHSKKEVGSFPRRSTAFTVLGLCNWFSVHGADGINRLNLVFLDVVTHLSFSMCDLETMVKQQTSRGCKD